MTFFSQQERELPGIPRKLSSSDIGEPLGFLGKKSQVSKNIKGNWFSKSQVSKISIQNQQVLEKITNKNDVLMRKKDPWNSNELMLLKHPQGVYFKIMKM